MSATCYNAYPHHSLTQYKWGEQLSYTEVSASSGRWAAIGTVAAMGVGGLAVVFPPSRWALLRWVLPKPGQGPSEELRRNGELHLALRSNAPLLTLPVPPMLAFKYAH